MTLHESFFITDEPVARPVTLADGTAHTLHFKQLPAAEFRKFFYAVNSDNDNERADATTRLIVACLCTPDGKPALTAKEAARLKPAIEKVIFNAVLEANGMTGEKKAGNALPPGETSGSGTSSPSPLAAAQ